MPRRAPYPGIVAVLMTLLTISAGAAEYHVDKESERLVRFISDAPLEDFDGITEQIDGYVIFAGDSLSPSTSVEGSTFYFEVALGSFETGLGLRDRHMRNDYLHTDRFPYAAFEGQLTGVNRDESGDLSVACAGSLSLHGVSQPLELTLSVSRLQAGYRVAGGFTIALTDYGIEVPSLMFMKIDEEIAVELSLGLKLAGE